jgi:DNA-binding MarR family transcriptional regulator
MKRRIRNSEYQALAEWRYRIRQFTQEGDSVALASGLEPQQYLMLLAIRGLPTGEEPKISILAQRLAIKHHSAVELIDRLQARGLARRSHSLEDRRNVLVSLSPRGEKRLEKIVRQRIGELQTNGARFIDALTALIKPRPATTQNRTDVDERIQNTTKLRR